MVKMKDQHYSVLHRIIYRLENFALFCAKCYHTFPLIFFLLMSTLNKDNIKNIKKIDIDTDPYVDEEANMHSPIRRPSIRH